MTKITVFNQQKDLPIRAASVKLAAKNVIQYEKFTTDEVVIYFVTARRISRLHQQFFADPSFTDCISFPIDGNNKTSGYHILGEIFICPRAAIEYDSNSPYSEVTLYLVHGLLHLMGHEDTEPLKRAKMRRAEKRHMKRLKESHLLITKINI